MAAVWLGLQHHLIDYYARLAKVTSLASVRAWGGGGRGEGEREEDKSVACMLSAN